MHACRPQHYSAAALFQLACWLQDGAVVLCMFAQRLDAWMAANKQAAVDRRLLYRMSEHDLRDIGLSHADLRTLHDDWFINRHENTRVTGTLFL